MDRVKENKAKEMQTMRVEMLKCWEGNGFPGDRLVECKAMKDRERPGGRRKSLCTFEDLRG